MKGYAYILGAAALWGMIGPFSRLAFSEGLAPMEVAFWRAVLAWVFFGSHAVLRRQFRVRRSDVPIVALFGFTGVTLFYATYQEAINRGGAAMAAILLYTAPAWVTIMARIFFAERLTPAKMAALVMALAGVAGISAGSGETHAVNTPAVLFGLAAGFCYSLYYIFGKHLSSRYSSPNLFLYMLPLGALTLYPLVDFAPKSAKAWTGLLCLSVFCTYGAYYLYYRAVQILEASRAAIAATLEPVVAGLVAYLWWGEIMTPMGYAGGVLILAAVVLVILEGRSFAGRGNPHEMAPRKRFQ